MPFMMVKLLRKYGTVLLFIGLWETASRLEWVNPLFVPPFSEVLATLWDLITSGKFLQHVSISLQRALLGFLIALVVSIPLGALMAGWSKNLQIAIEPVVEIFSQINPFLLFHILLLFMGIGEATKVSVIAWTCIWPILFSTLAGIRSIDPDIIKAAKAFGLKSYQLFFQVLLPGAGAEIFTGIRLSAGYSFLLLIAAEMMGASSGLGWLVTSAQNGYQVTKVFAGITVIALLGLFIDSMMEVLQKRLVLWEEMPLPEKSNK